MAPAQQQALSNDALRALFLGTAVRRSQEIPAQKYNLNGPLVYEIPKAGVGEKIRVLIFGTITSGVAASSTGKRFPYSLFNRVRLTDPLGVDRITAKPWFLYRLMFYKRYGLVMPFNIEASQYPNPTDVVGAAALTSSPLPATANAFAIGTATQVVGYFDIPLTMSPVDLRGAFRLDVANGETTLTLDPAPVLSSGTAGVDIPITTGGGATIDISNLSVKLIYYYYDPVAVQVSPQQTIVPYPLGDMGMVHEITYSEDSSGLTPGSEKLTTLPTGREFYRIIQNINNATTTGFAQALVTRRRWLIDGNIPSIDESTQAYLSDYLERYGSLPPDTEFIWNMVDRPWDSNRYGSLQTGLTIASGATVNAGAKVETLRESLYQTVQVPA